MTTATGSPATMRAVQYDHYRPPARYRLEAIEDAHSALERGGSLGKHVVALAAPGDHTDTTAAVFIDAAPNPVLPAPSS